MILAVTDSPAFQPLNENDEADRQELAERRRSFRRVAFFFSVLFIFTAFWMVKTHILPRFTQAVGDGRDPATYGFDLSNLSIPRKVLAATGMPRDSRPVLFDPTLVQGDDLSPLKNSGGRILDTSAIDPANDGPRHAFNRFIVGPDLVIGVTISNQSRAYSLRVMQWHEIVNDTLGDTPIAVTYSPLCDSIVVFDRRVEGKKLTFAFSGLLANSNLVMYDREGLPTEGAPPGTPKSGTASLWSQLKFEAVSGPLVGQKLSLLPFTLTTWTEWRKAHPQTSLLFGDPDVVPRYKDSAVPKDYFEHTKLYFPVDPMPPADAEAKPQLMTPVVYRRTATGDPIITPGHESSEVLAHTRWFAWQAFHGGAGIKPNSK